jgi:uncharacterized protein Yka (UPF0111/DUF47 family)
MVKRADTLSLLDELETALDSSCGALMALESLRAQAVKFAPEIGSVQEELTRTITSLMDAVAELRSLQGKRTSVVAFGFVLEADRGVYRDQVRPRRTA